MTSDSRTIRDSATRNSPIPPEFDDLVAWVTWLYYADQLTQSEIAEIVGLSRATVVKVLQEARERGAVTIKINTEAVSRTKLSRALAERFSLEAAHLIPNLEGAALTARLGDAGARVLADLLQPEDILGVAWGRAVLAVAAAMPAPERRDPLTIVQVTGSSPGGTAEFSPELCSSLLASRLHARCANLLAPAVVSNPELRSQLLAEPALVEQFKLIRSANRVLFGVGDIGPTSTVRLSGLASRESLDGYAARGAVGVIIGRFIDAEGCSVCGDLDDRMIGITLEELRAMPNRLCVAGGPGKIKALRAALIGGYVQRLVTDAATAEALLA